MYIIHTSYINIAISVSCRPSREKQNFVSEAKLGGISYHVDHMLYHQILYTEVRRITYEVLNMCVRTTYYV